MTRNAGGIFAALVLSLAYLCYVFQVFGRAFWSAGIGDWVDPYFLNYLMEHWHASIWTWSDPFSPPMFYPVDRTLGRCGHPLIFYVPFYEVVRPFLHPFVAYDAALLLMIATGTVCLFVLLRTLTSVSNIEALALTALFLTSKNVINGFTVTWSQRASVFVIPPILLLVLFAKSSAAAFAGGLTSALLFIHDFYTAVFAVVLAVAFVPLGVGPPPPAAGRRGRRPYIAFLAGAAIGLGIFVWLYLPAYGDQRAFSSEELLGHIRIFEGKFDAFESLRSFKLIAIVAALALLPWWKTDRKTRLFIWWFALLSAVVLFVPYRVGGFSVWMSAFARLPGFGAIRDPKRIIYLYDLAVVIAVAIVMSRLPARVRVALTFVVVLFIATDWNRFRFSYARPVAVFDHWVERPIQIDPSCRSFFIAEASTAYTSRSPHQWTLYGVDSMFIATKYRLPTLNGYTGVTPDGWDLPNPYDAEYIDHVNAWIERNRLTGVCVFDIEPRTMRPYRVARLPAGAPLTYAILGDSTAVGVGAPKESGIASATTAVLARKHRVAMTNFAVSGARIADVVRKQLPAAEALKPDLVLISAGANDVTHLTPIHSMRRDLRRIIRRLKRANASARIVITGSPDMGSPPRIPRLLRPIAAWQTHRVNRMMKEVASEERLVFAPIAEVTGPMFRRDPSLFDSDRFHPNARGYATWIPVLNEALAKALE